MRVVRDQVYLTETQSKTVTIMQCDMRSQNNFVPVKSKGKGKGVCA